MMLFRKQLPDFWNRKKTGHYKGKKEKDISLDFEEAVRDPLKDISAKKSFMKKPAKKFTKEPVKTA